MTNKFIGYVRGFPDSKSFAPTFGFKTHTELMESSDIQSLLYHNIPPYEFRMSRQKRTWHKEGKVMTGVKVNKEFFTVILMSNNHKSWVVIGRCEKDVPEIKDWNDEYRPY